MLQQTPLTTEWDIHITKQGGSQGEGGGSLDGLDKPFLVKKELKLKITVNFKYWNSSVDRYMHFHGLY